MSVIALAKIPNYGSINSPTETVTLPPVENSITQAKICSVSRRVFFTYAGAFVLTGAVLTGGVVAFASGLPGAGVVLTMSCAMIPFVYRRVVQDCPILCCTET